MTQARRPDGTGGPLKEDERIDDIQFYVDPRADLWIDDIVLYDAAPDDEKEPFPKHITFTGWFDTGKQGAIGSGAEWPGEYEIVLHEKPRTWDAAKSVVNKAGDSVLNIHMRGLRPLTETVELRFKYRLTGADTMDVALSSSKDDARLTRNMKDVKKDEWALAVVRWDNRPTREGDGLRMKQADEIRFSLPKGAVLLVDDAWLYEPGEPGVPGEPGERNTKQ
jgi:hypothetical protein